jgi:signal transduction histidine kinase
MSSASNAPDTRALDALYRVASQLGRADEPTEALRGILATLVEIFGAISGSVSLLNPDTGRLEIEVQQGLPDDHDDLALRLGQGVTGWVAFHGRPQLVPDVAADPRYIPVRPDVRCEMTAPMLENGGQVLGVINLDSDRVDGFRDDDLQLFIRLTEEATSVLLRLWRLEQLRGKARELESLIGIGQSLVTKLEPRDLFETIARDARQITQARACALYTYDSVQAQVRLAALDGEAPIEAPSGDLPLDSCLVSAAIQTRRQVEYANVQSPEFIDVVDLPRDPGLRSVLATPLRFENEVIGVLAVFTAEVHRFNNDERRLLSALASLAAVALQNSRLYARVFQSEASLRKNEQLTTLGLLAAEIAHEIRNPLTVIKLLFGYLGLDFPEGDPRRTDVRVIGEKIDQLEAIVTRVLTFAKAPSSLHSRWPIHDIIEDTIVLIRLKLAQSKIQLHYEPAPRTLVVDVHKGQLQQVLLNLLLNSTQAMPDGGTIALRCSRETRDNGAEFVLLDVTDSGTGIPEALREHIFDSFLSGRSDGTGLGLAIAKRILLSHHGDITLLETSSAGTTLRLALPLAKH